jgi:predicted PhzF superfamily epimerase YddE/YHI9
LQISPNYPKALGSSKTIKEVVITAKSEEEEYDFYSRCFCPWIGIDEDPVTGASHSVLAKYWGEKLDKKEMSAYQLSKRGGFLNLKILDAERLEVSSNAQIVFEGMLNIE